MIFCRVRSDNVVTVGGCGLERHPTFFSLASHDAAADEQQALGHWPASRVMSFHTLLSCIGNHWPLLGAVMRARVEVGCDGAAGLAICQDREHLNLTGSEHRDVQSNR